MLCVVFGLVFDTVASRRDDAVRIERCLDAGAGIAKCWHCLAHVEVVVVDRRAADEHAAGSDFFRHFSVAGVGARPLIGILAIECNHVQAAGEAGAANDTITV